MKYSLKNMIRVRINLRRTLILLSVFIGQFLISVKGQTCNSVQNVDANHSNQIKGLLNELGVALKDENLILIDSLSAKLKQAYGTEGGLPSDEETFYVLNSKVSWLNLNDAISLSRLLISKNSDVYSSLWKMGKGMLPPSYLPNSVFLRTSAEYAVGLLKIANYESDSNQKAKYTNWAITCLDSLATMQLASGAFPFPDLRKYNDAVFTSIIQNFLNNCGADSINVIKNGWIINDNGTGEFKFDAGVIANSYFEAYYLTNNQRYKDIVIRIGNYLLNQKYNLNYNYNTFSSLGLTRAFQLTSDSAYLHRAIQTIRLAVLPGQTDNGRWVDGHNASSRYHSIIIQNLTPTILILSVENQFYNDLVKMYKKAIENLIDQTIQCGSSTGYNWLLKLRKSQGVDDLKESINFLIGQSINQSASNGRYLDVNTMGEYMELLNSLTATNEVKFNCNLKLFPNPANDFLNVDLSDFDKENLSVTISDIHGHILCYKTKSDLSQNTSLLSISTNLFNNGIYILKLKNNYTNIAKLVILN